MDKSQILPNRKEYRASMRKFKHLRVAKKKSTKGAFGAISEYIREDRNKKAFKKNSKLSNKIVTVEKKAVTSTKSVKSSEPIVNKEVTKDNTQPIKTKELTSEVDKPKKDKKNETDVAEWSWNSM